MSFRRLVPLPAAALLAAVGLTSCGALESACPAVGWFNELAVSLEGDTSIVGDVKLCAADDICEPVDEPAEPRDTELRPLGIISSGGGGAEWTFTIDMYAPEEFSVRVFDESGTVIADEPVTPDWEQVSGNPACGGPSVATVNVPI